MSGRIGCAWETHVSTRPHPMMARCPGQHTTVPVTQTGEGESVRPFVGQTLADTDMDAGTNADMDTDTDVDMDTDMDAAAEDDMHAEAAANVAPGAAGAAVT